MNQHNPARRPFEDDGRFYAGHIKVGGHKRRCLCFVPHTAPTVGASASFSRAEAYHTAMRAAAGTLSPIIEVPPTVTAMLTAIIRHRGFPVKHLCDDVEIDETTAGYLAREFAA